MNYEFSLTENFTKFFGVSLNKVNPILLHIAIDYRNELPEWLKGKTKLTDLPRWKGEWYDKGENTVKIKYKPTDISEIITWVIEELYGFWKITPDGFSFEDAREAIYFKLKWC
jgi:hypothetical protein